MYNTCFWSLVQEGGMTEQEAHKELTVRANSHYLPVMFISLNAPTPRAPSRVKNKSFCTRASASTTTTSPPCSAKGASSSGSQKSWKLPYLYATSPPPSLSLSPLNELPQDVERPPPTTAPGAEGRPPRKLKPTKPKRKVVIVHEDFINDAWWETGRGAGVLVG